MTKWESMASDTLNEAVKRQVLQEQAPTAIRMQLMMQGLDNYEDMRKVVLGYVLLLVTGPFRRRSTSRTDQEGT